MSGPMAPDAMSRRLPAADGRCGPASVRGRTAIIRWAYSSPWNW